MGNSARLDASTLIAAIVTALVLAVAAKAAPDNDGPVRAWPGVGAGHRLGDGVLAAPQLSFSVPLLDVLEPEVVVGLGVNATAATFELTNRFSFGLRWFLPSSLPGGGAFAVDEPVRPFLWTAIHHGHKVAAADALKNPIGALLGSTDAGVVHLTGLEGGAGVVAAVDVDGTSWPVLLRAGVSWLPAFASLQLTGADEAHGHGDDLLLLLDLAVGLPLRVDER